MYSNQLSQVDFVNFFLTSWATGWVDHIPDFWVHRRYIIQRSNCCITSQVYNYRNSLNRTRTLKSNRRNFSRAGYYSRHVFYSGNTVLLFVSLPCSCTVNSQIRIPYFFQKKPHPLVFGIHCQMARDSKKFLILVFLFLRIFGTYRCTCKLSKQNGSLQQFTSPQAGKNYFT